jgi:prefoldin subunit 5
MSTEKFMVVEKEAAIKKKESLDKIREQHEKVVEIMSHLNEKLKKEVYVPVCENFAYFKGNIINTNECRVYLGDDFFVKTTNYKAVKILNNRKSKVEILLDEVNKQLNDLGVAIPKKNEINKIESPIKFENNFEFKNENVSEEPKNFANLKKLGDDTFEIMEEFNDKQETFDKIKSKQIPLQNEGSKINLDEKLQKLLHNRNLLTEEVSQELKPVVKLNSAISNESSKTLISTAAANKKKKDIVPLENKKGDLQQNQNIQEPQEEQDQQAKRSIFYLDNELDD